MKNIGVYVLLVVIGAAIGASALYFLMPNETPILTEQEVKVTIQGIKYENYTFPVFGLELLNDAPEKNLEGTVGIYQDNKQWTSEVTWYYTGYGEATILCDTINENQSFRITYNEKNPQATYLDRTIEWYEVDMEELVIIFTKTKELTITQMTFDTTNNITLHVTNSGTSDVTVSMVKVNGNTISSSNWNMETSDTVAAGASDKVQIQTAWTAGNKYSVSLFTPDGILVGSYTDTA